MDESMTEGYANDTDGRTTHTDGQANDPEPTDLPADAATEAERLTRLAREVSDPAEREAYLEARADVLGVHDYTARIREDDDTLVCHPDEWVEDGVIRTERIEDTDRAVEIPLSGPGDPEDWTAVAAHNEAVAETVADAHGSVHGANAQAFADFMGNHYARPIETADPAAVSEFLAEYFPRNAWPDDDQRAVVERSVELAIETAREDPLDG